MTISPRKRERLAAFLGSLTTAAALKLFSSLEAERTEANRGRNSGGSAPGANALPHGELISDLRDRLVQRGAVFPPRKPDARRMFFEPFEDFFIGAHTGAKHKAQIARSSLIPIWRLMMADQTTDDAAQAAARLDDALRDGADGIDVLERALFIAAEAGLGRLCARADEDHAARNLLVAALGSEEAYKDLVEIRQLLEGVEFLKQLQRLISSATPALTEEQYYDLRTLFLSAHNQSRAIGVYILLALKGRLERPWRALGVYYHLAQGADDRLRAAKAEVMALPESLFEDLEVLARGLESDCAKALDAETAGMRIAFFADFADGLARQSARAGDNVYLNRIEACREVAGEALDRFAEQALAGLRAAMPVRHAGGSSRLKSLRPDLSRPITALVVEDAADAAQLIAKAQTLAERLSADQHFTTSIADDAVEQLHTYAMDLVTEVRAAEGVERKTAQRTLDSVLMVAAPLLNSDEIGEIRERAANAFMTI